MTTKLSAEEKAIVDYVESSEATSVDNVTIEKKRYRQIAVPQMSKMETVSQWRVAGTMCRRCYAR